ncbi:MAG: sigma 54-interacting transcriptional regulator [Candidatus Glassbacteria bacterium]|nr:sigma 54-interacting transcriptional regulator [Candidatus Glassbacteria bacterium]
MRQKILFTLLAAGAFLFASREHVSAEKYPFKTYTVDDGLESNHIGSIMQDRQGYLWLATPAGACKFDGITFTTYTKENGLTSNNVSRIFEDSRGDLWISFWGGGVSKFDGKNCTTIVNDFLRNNNIWAILEDSRDRMWFTTFGGGVACFDGAGWHYYTTADGLADNRVRTVIEDSQGNLWFGVQQYGVSRFDGKNWKTFYPTEVGTPCHINSIIEDKQGNIWLAGYSRTKRKSVAIKISGPLEEGNHKVFSDKDGVPMGDDPSLCQDSQGNIWYGAQGGGLCIYDGKSWKTYTTQNGLPSNIIGSIFEDKEKNLWFGTIGDGLARLRGMAFVTYTEADGLPGNSIAPDLEDSKGNLWFNDRYVEGVTRYDGRKWTTFTTSDGLVSNQIVGLYQDRKGTLWFSSGYELSGFDGSEWKSYFPGKEKTWIGGAFYEDNQGILWLGGLEYKFDGRELEPFLEAPGMLPTIYAQNTDKAGNIIFGTLEGLVVFNGLSLRRLHCGGSVRDILADSRGNLWFATENGVLKSDIDDLFEYAGANQRVGGQWYTTGEGLAHNDVWTIHEDAAGAFWVGTNGGGVSRLDGTGITNYTVQDGLSSNICYFIIECGNHLYFVSPNGLNRFNGETFNVYTADEGFAATTEYRPLKDSKSNIWFRSPNGVIKYTPSADRPTLIPPPVYITRLRILDRDTTVAGGLELGYDKNSLRIDYVGICLAAPEDVLYSYMLEGLDTDWIQTHQSSISYPYLPPGEYTFKVKARNKDGIWSEQTAELAFKILPPFWATIWFKALIFILAMSVLWGIHAIRTRYITKRNLELQREVAERKKAEEALRKKHAEVESLKNRLQAENIYLQEEIKIEHNFEEIISNSEALNRVLEKVEQVASTDATVLILGETGTGKQLIARAVHNVSPRAGRTLVTVNCAALPSSLIESELFGHEKGAFTGAFSRKIGRFELADCGSIFLDEIGDLPLDLQAKLLRVLQDGEFERLGSSSTVKVDVRVIAATNRDLGKEVSEGRFREDLFYRLNVYPIHCPPLREHKEDIPLLVNHFVNKYSAKTGKKIDSISQHVIDSLQAYHWPGNVRELENVIERAVIVSRGNRLELAEWLQSSRDSSDDDSQIFTLEELEREHIIKVMELTGWRVRGKSGSAELLGIKPTTLESRMDKLGIKRKS